MLSSLPGIPLVAGHPVAAGRLRAKLFRGLADPARLSLVESLLDHPHGVSELVERTGLAQPNASKHLACLRECGLVTVVRDGRTATYHLRPSVAALLVAANVVLQECGALINACGDDRENT